MNTRKLMRLYGPIRSFLYKLGNIQSDGKQAIVGHGFGHGVGMSQWGAQLFAKQGWDAHRILKHYYSGVIVTKI
jgi:stage II sporulation protein D